MLDAGPFDPECRAGHRRESDERSHFDVVRADLVRCTPQRQAAFNRVHVRTNAVDACAECDEEAREILHMRFTRRVAEDRASLGRDGRHQRVLGRRDAGLIEKDVRANERLGGKAEPLAQFVLGAKRL